MSTITIYSTAGESEIIHWENGKAMAKKDDFDEVLQALKDLFDVTADVDRYFSKNAESVFEKAKAVIVKFNRVGGE
jgi:hypothetical protein